MASVVAGLFLFSNNSRAASPDQMGSFPFAWRTQLWAASRIKKITLIDTTAFKVESHATSTPGFEISVPDQTDMGSASRNGEEFLHAVRTFLPDENTSQLFSLENFMGVDRVSFFGTKNHAFFDDNCGQKIIPAKGGPSETKSVVLNKNKFVKSYTIEGDAVITSHFNTLYGGICWEIEVFRFFKPPNPRAGSSYFKNNNRKWDKNDKKVLQALHLKFITPNSERAWNLIR